MIQQAPAVLDDPWGEHAYAARLAGRPKHTVRDHLAALHTSSKLTRWFRQQREPQVIRVTPEKVLATLRDAGVNPVLMGTHGINGYRDEARATQDVDVLVARKGFNKAVRTLEEAFPYLEAIENGRSARFLDPVSEKVVIDVMKSASPELRAVFRHSIPVGKNYRIPNLEMAIVSKFLGMTACDRPWDKRFLDAGDFTNMVEYNRQALRMEKLRRLAERAQPGGGARMTAFVADIDAGRRIQL